jgi:hypothetical protein
MWDGAASRIQHDGSRCQYAPRVHYIVHSARTSAVQVCAPELRLEKTLDPHTICFVLPQLLDEGQVVLLACTPWRGRNPRFEKENRRSVTQLGPVTGIVEVNESRGSGQSVGHP